MERLWNITGVFCVQKTPVIMFSLSNLTDSHLDFPANKKRDDSCCTQPFLISTLIIVIIMVSTLLMSVMLHEIRGINIIISIPYVMNSTCLIMSLVVIGRLIFVGSQNSISGIVAQRLNPSSYLFIIFISYLISTQCMMITLSFSNSDRGRNNQTSFCFLLSSPLFMGLILVYPLIVQRPLYDSGLLDSMASKNKINLPLKHEFQIWTFTSNELVASTFHTISVVSGIIMGFIGTVIVYHDLTEGFKIISIASIIISGLGIIGFMILGHCYPDQELYEENQYYVEKRQISITNRLRIFFEYLALSFCLLLGNIVSADLLFY